MTGSHRLRAFIVTALGVAAAAPASAFVDWSLTGSAGYDDNPERAARSSSGSGTLYGGGTLTIDEKRPRLDALVGANIGYLEYLKGGYSGQLLGSVKADLRYALIPKTLFWSLDDTFGQGAQNALAAATPQNRTNVNIFSTGPSLVLPINSITRFTADARLGIDTYQSGYQPNDVRYTGSVGVVRQLSTASSLALNGEYLKVNYSQNSSVASNPLAPLTDYSAADYDRQSAYLRYLTGDKRNTLTADLGVSKVKQNNETFNSPLARLNLTHKVTAYWSVGVGAAREFTDGAQNFAGSVGNSGLPLPGEPPPGVNHTTQTLPLTNQPLKSDSGSASATYTAARTSFSVGGSVAHDRFLTADRSDDNRTDGNVSFSRRLSPHSDLHLGASYEYRDFINIGTSDHTIYGNATYTWQFEGAYRVYGAYNYEKRSSSSGIYSYTDNRISIGITYAPVHRRDSSMTNFALPR